MLSVHNVHANAATIHSVGADKKMLNNAICFELSGDGEQRSTNLKKNRELILGLRKRLALRRHRIHWIAGHVGIDDNERADALARKGVEESR